MPISFESKSEQGVENMSRLESCTEFEKIVISSSLRSQEFFLICKTEGVSQNDFTIPLYRELWAEMDKSALTDGISPIIVSDKVDSHNAEDKLKKESAIAELSKHESAEVDSLYAIKKIKENTSLRALLRLSSAISESVKGGETADNVLNEVLSRLFNIESSEKNIIELSAPQAAKAVGREIKQRLDGEVIDGVPSGIATLDKEIKCFYFGLYTIIMGRPGHCKTTLMINCFLNNLLAGKKPVFISMEMPAIHLMIKILGIMTEIPVNKILAPKQLSNQELELLRQALSKLTKQEFYIIDAVSLNVVELGMYLQKYIKKGCQICYLDYIQLLKLPDNKTPHDAGEHRTIAKTVREIIKRVNRMGNMALVVGAQAGRSADQRPIEERIPQMRDLEWSSSLEQDASTVIGVMNREKYEGEACEYKNQLFLGFCKHRYQNAVSINLAFLKDIQLITDLAHPERIERTLERWHGEVKEYDSKSKKEAPQSA